MLNREGLKHTEFATLCLRSSVEHTELFDIDVGLNDNAATFEYLDRG